MRPCACGISPASAAARFDLASALSALERPAEAAEHYRRAIDRYRDALFYLNQDMVKEEVRLAGREKIEREIAQLKARLQSKNGSHERAAEDSGPKQ